MRQLIAPRDSSQSKDSTDQVPPQYGGICISFSYLNVGCQIFWKEVHRSSDSNAERAGINPAPTWPNGFGLLSVISSDAARGFPAFVLHFFVITHKSQHSRHEVLKRYGRPGLQVFVVTI
jgi:hypothetical protein